MRNISYNNDIYVFRKKTVFLKKKNIIYSACNPKRKFKFNLGIFDINLQNLCQTLYDESLSARIQPDILLMVQQSLC